MQENFANGLSYNGYLFGVVDEGTITEHNYVYGEEHNSIGSNSVSSVIFHHLKNFASQLMQSAFYLVCCSDG